MNEKLIKKNIKHIGYKEIKDWLDRGYNLVTRDLFGKLFVYDYAVNPFIEKDEDAGYWKTSMELSPLDKYVIEVQDFPLLQEVKWEDDKPTDLIAILNTYTCSKVVEVYMNHYEIKESIEDILDKIMDLLEYDYSKDVENFPKNYEDVIKSGQIYIRNISMVARGYIAALSKGDK